MRRDDEALSRWERRDLRPRRVLTRFLAALIIAGCGESTNDGAVTVEGGPTGVALTISAEAVDSCGSWLPDHQGGLNYQTPQNIKLGVRSVALMTSHDDPAPISLELAEPIAEVDLSEGASEVVTSDTGSIAEGTYTHLAIGLAYSIYEVAALAHAGIDIPGTLTVDMALSDHSSTEDGSRSQGQYTATFTALGQSYNMEGSTPLNCTLSVWGGIARTVGSDFEVMIPIPGGPVVVDHHAAEPISRSLVFPVGDAYVWRDLDEPGFSEGQLDIAQPPATSELPDALVECQLLMADRCQGEAIAPLHPTWPMPDSNLEGCSDGTQITESCPVEGEPLFGQDGCYSINPLEYEIHEQAVGDLVTGLIWQRDTPAETYDWWEAREYCTSLELDDSTDWRLPSRIELVSLLDLGALDPTIDPIAFPDTRSDFYWSSSPVPFLNLAYGVRFELGFIYDHDPTGSGRVRCVRGGYQPPDPRFSFDDLTVRDNGSGLQWQRSHEGPATWQSALELCEQLSLDGHLDWRLPTLKELQTLVDERRLQPSTDVEAFPDTPSEWFWSSTPISYPPNEAWATSFTDGYASIMAFSELHLLRCVRDGSD